MSKIMDLKNVSNHSKRNAFPYERRTEFSAKVGELLPIRNFIMLPGQTISGKHKTFSRTQPLNTAAYTRVREYYDYFFVPLRLLWKDFQPFVTSMTDNPNKAASIEENSLVTDTHPFMYPHEIRQYINRYQNSEGGFDDYVPDSTTGAIPMHRSDQYNYFGYNRGALTEKLMQYLGYSSTRKWPTSVGVEYPICPWALLSYQKIYQDFFRESQWEKAETFTWNIDYLSSGEKVPVDSLAGAGDYRTNHNMFDLRYCNWPKDYFLGLKPRAQYGDEAGVSLYIDPSNVQYVTTNFYKSDSSATFNESDVYATSLDGNNVKLTTNGSSQTGLYVNVNSVSLRNELSKLQSSFSILALRQAQALQKWKEIVQCHDQDYRDQVKAIFGVNVPVGLSNQCQWIGGWSTNVDINEVVNTNLTDNAVADIAGKGIGMGDGHFKFTAKEHGIFMCIYHAMPIPDFDLDTIETMNRYTTVHDYANPCFDKIGMQAVTYDDIMSNFEISEDRQSGVTMGYGPRYLEYKTTYDNVLGAFSEALGTLETRAWVAPITEDYIKGQLLDQDIPLPITYGFFKVNPAILDNLFPTDTDNTCATDRLFVNSFLDIKSVVNLDYDGLPY